MRVKKFRWVGAVTLLMALIFSFPNRGLAYNFSLNQTILPVRFIYTDANGNVTRTWTNVKDGDNFYIIKFFDLDSDRELTRDKGRMESFIQAERSSLVSFQSTLSVEFINSGNGLQEVRTIV